MFVVMYDLGDMPSNSQTVIRQRTVYVPVDPDSDLPCYLRYLIHLRSVHVSLTQSTPVTCIQCTVYVPVDPNSDLPCYLRYLIHLRSVHGSLTHSTPITCIQCTVYVLVDPNSDLPCYLTYLIHLRSVRGSLTHSMPITCTVCHCTVQCLCADGPQLQPALLPQVPHTPQISARVLILPQSSLYSALSLCRWTRTLTCLVTSDTSYTSGQHLCP